MNQVKSAPLALTDFKATVYDAGFAPCATMLIPAASFETALSILTQLMATLEVDLPIKAVDLRGDERFVRFNVAVHDVHVDYLTDGSVTVQPVFVLSPTRPSVQALADLLTQAGKFMISPSFRG